MERIGYKLGSSGLALAVGLWVLQSLTATKAQDSAATIPSPSSTLCPDRTGMFADSFRRPHWNGWGVNLSQDRFQPPEIAQLNPEDVRKLKLKWAFGFPGVNRTVSQVTVLGGRLFVGNEAGKVYSLNANNG